MNSEINKEDENLYHIRDSLLICDNCFETGNFPKGLKKENFETANFFNIVNPSESKFNF